MEEKKNIEIPKTWEELQELYNTPEDLVKDIMEFFQTQEGKQILQTNEQTQEQVKVEQQVKEQVKVEQPSVEQPKIEQEKKIEAKVEEKIEEKPKEEEIKKIVEETIRQKELEAMINKDFQELRDKYQKALGDRYSIFEQLVANTSLAISERTGEYYSLTDIADAIINLMKDIAGISGEDIVKKLSSGQPQQAPTQEGSSIPSGGGVSLEDIRKSLGLPEKPDWKTL